MKNARLTRQEKAVLEFVVRYRAENLISPSIREIAAGIGVSSFSTAHRHIQSLAEKGWILIPGRKMRCIVPNPEKVAMYGTQESVC